MDDWLTILRYVWFSAAWAGVGFQLMWMADARREMGLDGPVALWQYHQSLYRILGLLPIALAATLVALEPLNLEPDPSRRLVVVNLFLSASAIVGVVAPFALWQDKRNIRRRFLIE